MSVTYRQVKRNQTLLSSGAVFVDVVCLIYYMCCLILTGCRGFGMPNNVSDIDWLSGGLGCLIMSLILTGCMGVGDA